MADQRSLAGELTEVFARMSGLLLSHETVTTALDVVTALAAETIPDAEGCGITLRDPHGNRTTSGASNELVERADAMQYTLEEGPCLTAWRDRVVVRVDDTLDDDRWPRWCSDVQALGVRSALSAPLVAADDGLGAIKVYSTRAWAFDTRSEHLLTMFAAQAAVLLANVQSFDRARRMSDGLKASLRDRELVAMAKGMVMQRNGISEEQAFAVLVNEGHHQRRGLRAVAADLVASATGRRAPTRRR